MGMEVNSMGTGVEAKWHKGAVTEGAGAEVHPKKAASIAKNLDTKKESVEIGSNLWRTKIGVETETEITDADLLIFKWSNFCKITDRQWFNNLLEKQNQIEARGFTNPPSIHSKEAVDFGKQIFNSPLNVIKILEGGYTPG